jgi:phage gpG-like protein
MLDIKIEGQLPKLNSNLEPAMEKIADIMFRSVQQNFITGGRPDQWQPLKSGQPSHLYRNGWLFENVQLSWTPSSATVYVDLGRVPYAIYLQMGTKHMVAREFMMFQEQDKEKILQEVSSAIFSQTGETKWEQN